MRRHLAFLLPLCLVAPLTMGAADASSSVDTQPPALGSAFPTRVPQVNEVGNEIAGVPTVEKLVPLATYAPWCLRHGAPANPDELADFFGTYIPLPRTDDEKQAKADGRPSIKTLHPDRIVYLRAVATAADELIEHYCTLTYSQTGSYMETSRRLGLDRRTVKSRVNQELLDRLKKG